jgi:hypothetical protein
VSILNVETGESRVLGVGWHPVVSEDGTAVVVQEFDGSLRRIRVSSGISEPVSLPGLWGPILAVRDDCALYWALPTYGQDQRFTKNNSPLSGPKAMVSVKAGIFNSQQCQTVLPYADPRRVGLISYGVGMGR